MKPDSFIVGWIVACILMTILITICHADEPEIVDYVNGGYIYKAPEKSKLKDITSIDPKIDWSKVKDYASNLNITTTSNSETNLLMQIPSGRQGKLVWNETGFHYTGDADVGAKMLFNYMQGYFDRYLEDKFKNHGKLKCTPDMNPNGEIICEPMEDK